VLFLNITTGTWLFVLRYLRSLLMEDTFRNLRDFFCYVMTTLRQRSRFLHLTMVVCVSHHHINLVWLPFVL